VSPLISQQIKYWRVHLLCVLAFIPGILYIPPSALASRSSQPLIAPSPSQGIPNWSNTEKLSPGGATVYFPQIYIPDPIWQDTAIWAHNVSPAAHEVALFRYKFTLNKALQDSELHLFADTRYEVWLDGNLVGRGPARFSRTLHEYDVYPLDDLSPGEHLLAVLVQWAPNLRRSESSQPHLLGHIQGENSGEVFTPVRTGPWWKCQLSTAWRQDAVPVHAWDLIGPTELLDLRQLPANWNLPGFNDTHWFAAVSLNWLNSNTSSDSSEGFTFRPRSIPLLVEYTKTPVVIDAGLISPGFRIGEITPPFSDPYNLDFSNSQPAKFTLKALAIPGETAANVYLDGSSLSWQSVDSERPDLYAAQVQLLGGGHSLSFESIPPRGMTFSLQEQDFQYNQIPFDQGVNAGRRLLLADLVRNPESVKKFNETELSLEFGAQPSYVILDLGQTRLGRLQASLEGPEGIVVDIGWDERLTKETHRPLPYPGSLHPEWNQVDSWIMDSAQRDIATLDERAGRYILIAVWGGPVKMKDIRFIEGRYPAEQTSAFHSSDPLLDRIWQVGVDTLYPNMQDAYTDTPWRERGQWWGDAYIADHVNRVSLGDTQLIKRGISYMADTFLRSPSPGLAPNNNSAHILDYGMLWVGSLTDYYQNTMDHPFLLEMFPLVANFVHHLALFENVETGLLDIPEAPWSETAYIESLGYQSRYGQSTALNAMYYGTLLQAAYLAQQTGDTEAALAWEQKAATVKQQTNQLLFLADQQRYNTTFYQGESYPPTPQAQAWALAYGLVEPEYIDDVTDALIELLSSDPSHPNLDIYGMYWVLEALGRTGHIQEALEIINNYYDYLLSSGATTWWEKFEAGDQYPTSLSHVWGGSPTWFLSTYLLGAERTGPQTWRIKPALSGVTYASGNLKLQSSDMNISWMRSACQTGTITIQAGEDTRGELILPLANPILSVTQDGQKIWQDGKSATQQVQITPEGLLINLPGGEHTISIEFGC
jgi:alpha-L-rhamnosidase